jgi:putative transposase
MAFDLNYTRHLPHQVPAGFPIFVTWNLKGAMPASAIEELELKRRRLERQPPRARETRAERTVRENKILFGIADRYLDEAVHGPMHLKDPAAAKIVEDAILFGAGERYDLFAWCVMSNHVHVLLTPSLREIRSEPLQNRQAGKPDLQNRQVGKPDLQNRQAGKPDLQNRQAGKPNLQNRQAGKPDVRRWDLPNVMQGIKGYTAHRINQLRDARGDEFWQDESYDHWSRDDDEMFRIIQYIEDNPVNARLCSRAEAWRWSSARLRQAWRAGGAFAGEDAVSR